MAKQFMLEFGPLQPQYEALRMMYDFKHHGLEAGELSRDRRKQRAIGYGTAAVTWFFPTGKQITSIPALLGGRMGVRQFSRTYGGHFLPFPSAAGIVVTGLMAELPRKSPGRAVAGTVIGGTKREDSRVALKSSRAAGAAQTLKPFWSNGKPKCRKGYRYDFKRKMCVKKS
ncbi:hypothetical protein OAJ37_02220 [Euryarchaeota archaeon]|nr:hypothetical protein [Euryarchaeota archaeon]